MFVKIGEMWRSANARFFLGMLAVAGAVAPGLVSAQDGSITLDTSISQIKIEDALTSLGGTLKSAIGTCLGIVVAIWALKLGWRTVKGFFSGT
ncbi:MAG: hypothetical protein Q4C70_04995 [Planctomycetia bacterium]|nr:hypothetical protein [Planctomycetia bacterium]